MSHRHFCDVAGHWWECEGKALRFGDQEPPACVCLPSGRPLEGFDHTLRHDPVEFLACPQHREWDAASAAPCQAKPGAEPAIIRDKDGNRVLGRCLWCRTDFYRWGEVAAHNANDMEACPVFQELKDKQCMPPLLQIKLRKLSC